MSNREGVRDGIDQAWQADLFRRRPGKRSRSLGMQSGYLIYYRCLLTSGLKREE